MNEADVRSLLVAEAEGFTMSSVPPDGLLRRARLRVALSAIGIAAALILTGVVGLIGVRAFTSAEPVSPAGHVDAPIPEITPPVARDRIQNPDELLVGSFFHDGKQWWVTINLDVGDRGHCAGLEYSVGGGETSGAGDCDSETPTQVPERNDVAIWPLLAWGQEEQLEIVGPVAKEVDFLELRFADGSRRAVDIVETNPSTGWEVDVFAAFLPPQTSGELVALDADGAVLDRVPLPAEDSR